MPRYLMLIRVDENDQPGGGPSEALMQRMGALIQEMTEEGTLLETAGLRSTSEGVRVTRTPDGVAVSDGPFTETKEVVGGYALLQAKDLDHAVGAARRFVEIHEPEWRLTAEVREIG